MKTLLILMNLFLAYFCGYLLYKHVEQRKYIRGLETVVQRGLGLGPAP